LDEVELKLEWSGTCLGHQRVAHLIKKSLKGDILYPLDSLLHFKGDLLAQLLLLTRCKGPAPFCETSKEEEKE
jgi:hypothetical protein